MIELHRILCPTDFSEFSDAALRYACELAKKFGAELHLLHVLQDYAAMAPAPGEVFAPFADWLPELRKQAQAQLAGMPNAECSEGLIIHRSAAVGAPIEEIVKYVKQHQIDLVVQGTHGRRGVKHLLMGSVAENVVRYVPCPVLTVRKTK